MVRLDHLALAVRDCRLSRDWYVRHLGFKVEFEIPNGGGSGVGVAAVQDDAGFTVFLEQIDAPVLSGQCSCTIQVDDVDALFLRLKSAVKVVAGPGKQFWGYGAMIADPDGHLFHLYDEATMKEKGG